MFGPKATTGLCQPLIAIMQRKPPALRNIGIDRNVRSINNFRCDCAVELIHGCCHRFLAEYPFRGRELVYADPPYLQATRRLRDSPRDSQKPSCVIPEAS